MRTNSFKISIILKILDENVFCVNLLIDDQNKDISPIVLKSNILPFVNY